MPERDIAKPFRIEVTSEIGREGLLVLDPVASTLGAEYFETVTLHPYEYQLLDFLARSPNEPFKLSDIKAEVPLFSEKYAPSPIEVVQGLIESAPVLSGHLLSIIKSTTQLFSFLDTAKDTKTFMENLELWLNDPGERQGKENTRRKERILRVVEVALGAAGTASAIIGYRHFRKTTNKSN